VLSALTLSHGTELWGSPRAVPGTSSWNGSLVRVGDASRVPHHRDVPRTRSTGPSYTAFWETKRTISGGSAVS